MDYNAAYCQIHTYINSFYFSFLSIFIFRFFLSRLGISKERFAHHSLINPALKCSTRAEQHETFNFQIPRQASTHSRMHNSFTTTTKDALRLAVILIGCHQVAFQMSVQPQRPAEVTSKPSNMSTASAFLIRHTAEIRG